MMWRLLFIAVLAPLPGPAQAASAAGAPVRQAAEPFAAEIAAFVARDEKSPPEPGGVLFIGSSSFRLWKTLAQDFADLPVINRGFGGSQIADSVRYADRIVIPYRPKMVVMYAGGNDLNAGKSPAQVLGDFTAFVEKVHAALPETRIVYNSINSSVARWSQEANVREANRLIKDYIRRHASRTLRLSYIDTHEQFIRPDGSEAQASYFNPDGLHPNSAGYALWTSRIHPKLSKLWKGDQR